MPSLHCKVGWGAALLTAADTRHTFQALQADCVEPQHAPSSLDEEWGGRCLATRLTQRSKLDSDLELLCYCLVVILVKSQKKSQQYDFGILEISGGSMNFCC